MARTKNRGIATEFLSLLYRPPLAAGRIHPALQGGLEKRERTTATASSTSVICSMTFTRSISENLKVFPNM